MASNVVVKPYRFEPCATVHDDHVTDEGAEGSGHGDPSPENRTGNTNW